MTSTQRGQDIGVGSSRKVSLLLSASLAPIPESHPHVHMDPLASVHDPVSDRVVLVKKVHADMSLGAVEPNELTPPMGPVGDRGGAPPNVHPHEAPGDVLIIGEVEAARRFSSRVPLARLPAPFLALRACLRLPTAFLPFFSLFPPIFPLVFFGPIFSSRFYATFTKN